MALTNTANGFAVERIQIPLTARADAGVLGSWQNTTGRSVLIFNRGIHVLTASTGAATADVGIASTAVTNDTLIDGQALNGVSANTVVQAAGSNGALTRIVPAGHFVTAFGSAATTGFTGNLELLVSEL